MTANPAGFQEFRARHPRLTALPGGRAPAPVLKESGPLLEEEVLEEEVAPTSEVSPIGRRACSTPAFSPCESITFAPRSDAIDSASQDDVLSVAACAGNPRAAAIIIRRYGTSACAKLHMTLIGSARHR